MLELMLARCFNALYTWLKILVMLVTSWCIKDNYCFRASSYSCKKGKMQRVWLEQFRRHLLLAFHNMLGISCPVVSSCFFYIWKIEFIYCGLFFRSSQTFMSAFFCVINTAGYLRFELVFLSNFRKESNRESARRSRSRKAARLKDLEEQVLCFTLFHLTAQQSFGICK